MTFHLVEGVKRVCQTDREGYKRMKIKQVEELVGITSKNIRFYEDQGLLAPRRTENGYRDYGQEEVVTLKKIKLFRKLGIPVEEIHKLFHKDISAEECLEHHEVALKKEQKNIERMRILTHDMLSQALSVETLNPDTWLDEVEKMEKEGVNFVNVSKIDIHMKKKMGAVAGAGVMIVIMILVLIVLIYGFFTDPNFPIWGLLITALPIIAVIIGTIVAMTSRMKEIDKGEEDEAAKY